MPIQMALTYVLTQVMPLKSCDVVATPVDQLCNTLLGHKRYIIKLLLVYTDLVYDLVMWGYTPAGTFY